MLLEVEKPQQENPLEFNLMLRNFEIFLWNKPKELVSYESDIHPHGACYDRSEKSVNLGGVQKTDKYSKFKTPGSEQADEQMQLKRRLIKSLYNDRERWWVARA